MNKSYKVEETLKNLRLEKNLTQGELSRCLNGELSQQKISDLENGEKKISADVVSIYAEFFNVSADYILGLSNIRSTDVNVQTCSKTLGLNEKIIDYFISLNSSDELCSVKDYYLKFLRDFVIWSIDNTKLIITYEELNKKVLSYSKNKTINTDNFGNMSEDVFYFKNSADDIIKSLEIYLNKDELISKLLKEKDTDNSYMLFMLDRIDEELDELSDLIKNFEGDNDVE